MRVTFVLPPVDMSGGIRVIAIYATMLTAHGHEVALVAPPHPKAPFMRKIKSVLQGAGWPATPTVTRSHFDGLSVDLRLLDRWRPPTDADVPDSDAVIATWWETAEWVCALGAKKGAKVYFIQHHEVFPYLPVSRCHATYKLPMHKIVVARWLQKVMSTQYLDDVVDVVPNSVDRSQFFSPVRGRQAVPTIGFLYSTASFKGLDVTLAAIDLLRKQTPQLRVICFGAQKPSIRMRLPAGAEFLFCPPQSELRRIYSRCDVWITASRSEGFNLPAMEAMACRTPVVATRTGWPDEAIVTGNNGVLVDVDDIEGLARGVRWVLSLSSDEWKGLSQRAYDTTNSGSWERSSILFEESLRRACRRAAKGEIAGECASIE